jgi:ATP-dependent DNA ligase
MEAIGSRDSLRGSWRCSGDGNLLPRLAKRQHRFQIFSVLRKNPFIAPSTPVLKPSPPTGSEWIHEVKFDGWRAQLNKRGGDVVVFTRNGHDFTKRFAPIRDSLIALPARSAIIDAELVACDNDGKPDFDKLMAGEHDNLCAWCFDLLELNGHDLRALPLVRRKQRLRNLIIKADDHVLRYSDEFPDPVKLLRVVHDMGLEGIVSKRRDQPYRSGKNPGWIKVKTRAWKAANRDRWEQFV